LPLMVVTVQGPAAGDATAALDQAWPATSINSSTKLRLNVESELLTMLPLDGWASTISVSGLSQLPCHAGFSERMHQGLDTLFGKWSHTPRLGGRMSAGGCVRPAEHRQRQAPHGRPGVCVAVNSDHRLPLSQTGAHLALTTDRSGDTSCDCARHWSGDQMRTAGPGDLKERCIIQIRHIQEAVEARR